MRPPAEDTTGGTYTLLIALADQTTHEVGRLGRVDLPAGHYAYTGSALGPGGFARVDRHRAVAAAPSADGGGATDDRP